MLYQEAYHDDATFRGNMMLRGGQGYQDVKGCSAMHRRAKIALPRYCVEIAGESSGSQG